MSSAANDKREQLEEQFRRRMHDAEATPPADLWARIDHTLTVQENNLYKHRLVFYRQLAAACFVLFVLAGSLFMYYFDKDKKQRVQLATQLEVPPAGPAIVAAPTTTVPQQIAQSIATNSPAPAASQPAPANLATPTVTLPEVALQVPAAKRQRQPAPAIQPIAAAPAYTTTATQKRLQLFSEKETTPTTVFASLQPFYQATQQTVTAVPTRTDHNQRIAVATPTQQLLRNPVALQPTESQDPASMLAKKSQSREQQQVLAAVKNDAKAPIAQPNEQDSRWTLAMAYAPGYFNQNASTAAQVMPASNMSAFTTQEGNTNTSLTIRDVQQQREQVETDVDPGFSFAFEAKVGFELVNRLKLLTGIGYAQNTARTKSGYVLRQSRNELLPNQRATVTPPTVFLPALSNSLLTTSAVLDETDAYNVNYRYRHLTLPVGLQYQNRLSKDWYWYASSGVAANFLLQSTIVSLNKEVKDINFDNDASPFRKVQMSGNVSAGVGRHLSNAVSISVGPEFRGYLNSLLAKQENGYTPQGRPYTIGLNVAVNYNLNRGN